MPKKGDILTTYPPMRPDLLVVSIHDGVFFLKELDKKYGYLTIRDEDVIPPLVCFDQSDLAHAIKSGYLIVKNNKPH